MKRTLRIGALISGGGTNLQAIIDACEESRIDAEMVFVGSDNPDAFGLERAVRHGVPTFVVDYAAIINAYKSRPDRLVLPSDFNVDEICKKQSLLDTGDDPVKRDDFLKTRALAEARLLANMGAIDFDLLVLAGFMRNLTPYFIDRVNTDPGLPKIMNIHPALLPSFPGVDGYGDTFRYGCKIAGCTVHFIDYGEDSGPIIGQKSFQILEEDTLDTVKEKGLALEWSLYPECVQLYAEGRLKLAETSFLLPNGQEQHRTIVRICKAVSAG